MRTLTWELSLLCLALGASHVARKAAAESPVPPMEYGVMVDLASRDTIQDIDSLLADFEEASHRTRNSMVLASCPTSCKSDDPKNWYLYPDMASLDRCNKTMLFDVSLEHDVSNHTKASLRACVADTPNPAASTVKFSIKTSGFCTLINPTKEKMSLHIGHQSSVSAPQASKDAYEAGQQLRNSLAVGKPACRALIRLAKSGKAIVGMYAGAQFQAQGLSEAVLDKALSHLQSNGVADVTVVQSCGNKQRGADFAFGFIASSNGDVTRVQSIMKAWNDGKCATGLANVATVEAFSMNAPAILPNLNSTSRLISRDAPSGNSDGTCKTQKVAAGDSCASLASKCGISPADFTSVNSDSSFCSGLKPGQHVCCSKGTMPDFSPKPNPDGSCAVHNVQSGESCASIAAENSLTNDDIESFNKKTWGWNGCSLLFAGINMCISKGDPPMPAPVSNAVCGPTVPGTQPPTDGKQLADLNPCPLKVCCNIWGQCGTTEDFCVISPSDTGAPGTAKPGSNGCVQNCGMDVVIGDKPAQEMRVAYFEAFNQQRDCLTMHADDIGSTKFTHVHFAFADLTEDYLIDISKVKDEFDRFVKLTGIKRILSFGGWDFSTSPTTYTRLRQAVQPANRDKFRKNIVTFLSTYNLDGVDIDWEYPGEPDIPGIPADDPNNGKNYLKFLAMLSSDLKSVYGEGKEKSLSIAAPASYWYLKAFPIDLMAKVVDYIVYMTYDLHGQWDVGNAWVSPGCPGGNCLRSHVNLTETINSLSMITKAGVNTNKIVVGVSSYGRSFHMSQAGCDGPMCTYTGTATSSDAAPGNCTKTNGYISDAELGDIGFLADNVKQLHDDKSDSDIMVYDDVQWVAHMTPDTKKNREKIYSHYNMAGTSDWAIDLAEFEEDRNADNGGSDPPLDLPPCDKTYDTIDAMTKDNPPWNCVVEYTFATLKTELDNSLKRYNDIVNDGYDHKFDTFARSVSQSWSSDMDDFYHGDADQYYDCLQARKDGETSDHHLTYKNVTVGCPPKNDIQEAYNIYFVPKDKDKLYKYIDDQWGMSPDALGGSNLRIAPCLPESEKSSPCSEWGNLIGAPELNKDYQVPNPKASVEKALDKIKDIGPFLEQVTWEQSSGFFYDDEQDGIDAVSMPVLMVAAAVDSMEQIKEAGEEIEKKERENIIILALTAIFFIIPGVGEALGAISGLASIARIATIVGEVGGAGLTVYDMATNPKNAPLDVFGLFLGGVAIKGAARGWLKDAANVRRGMKAEDVTNMGKIVSDGLDQIKTVANVCRKI